MAIHIQMENLGSGFYTGGLADQPHILVEEIQTCINAKNKAIEVHNRQNATPPTA